MRIELSKILGEFEVEYLTASEFEAGEQTKFSDEVSNFEGTTAKSEHFYFLNRPQCSYYLNSKK
jgi:hypothetical protein